MRGLSLLEPWATLMALGMKRIETRSWQTPYRGIVAIHASRATTGLREMEQEPAFRDAIYAARRAVLPGGLPEADAVAYHWRHGVVVALGVLVDVRSTNDPDFLRTLSDQEQLFGNYDPDRYGFVLTDVQPLVEPVPAKGKLGLWKMDKALQARVMDQLPSYQALERDFVHGSRKPGDPVPAGLLNARPDYDRRADELLHTLVGDARYMEEPE